MVFEIARKEFLDLLRDGRLRWCGAIIAALLLAATLVGWRSWREVSAERAAAQTEANRHFDEQEEKNPHAAAHYGLYVFKQKPSLSFLDPGVDPYTGVSIHLEAHRRNEAKDRPVRDSTAIQRFGELTAAVVLQVLLPLLVVFLVFPVIAAEREQGTLRLLMSLGVSPRSIVLGKLIGVTAALGLIVVPAAALGMLVLLAGGFHSERAWPHAPILGVAYSLYLGMFVVVSMAVSARCKSSRHALIILMALWIMNTTIAPRFATDLSRRLLPTPSSLEFQSSIGTELKAGIDGHHVGDERLERLKSELLAKHRVDTVEELPINFEGVALQASEDFGNEVHDRHRGRLEKTLGRQDTLRKALGILFPTLAIRELSMALAGTDNDHARDFADAAESHRRKLVRELNRDLEVNGAGLGFMYQAGPDLWRSMPRFRHRPQELPEILTRQTLGWVSLVTWFAAGIVLLNGATHSMRVD
ncbi:MAG: DUF3526 domain-containing protein [Isosphaeraceae bacterium]|nr:DUF3526 domain-containing protein [Isosphaeraceae bacterium]